VQRTSKLIQANAGQFPDCAYYLALFSQARRNAGKHPDICIETCKSLLEGISKTIILNLDSTSSSDDLDAKGVEPLVKSAAKLLRVNDDVIEDHFINRVGGLAHALGALRNARGDISHGKAVPKLYNSSDHFARLCLQMTDAVCFYMLKSYFEASKALPADEDGGDKPEASVLPGGLPDLAYEDNPDFNEDLDQRYPLEGKLVYSDALYRLFYEDYVIELEAFRDAQSDSTSVDEGDDGDAE